MIQRTFVAIKPDTVQRGLIGEIISRFEKKGFKIIGMKLMQIDRETAEKHYAEHINKPFFENLANFITSGPIVAMVLEGVNAVEVVRKMMGATNPQNADPGTIRADYAHTMERNVVHGSDSFMSAEREIGIFFSADELIPGWARDLEGHYIEIK
jgi:nucleoside-diphosphate kinase